MTIGTLGKGQRCWPKLKTMVHRSDTCSQGLSLPDSHPSYNPRISRAHSTVLSSTKSWGSKCLEGPECTKEWTHGVIRGEKCVTPPLYQNERGDSLQRKDLQSITAQSHIQQLHLSLWAVDEWLSKHFSNHHIPFSIVIFY